MFALLLAAALPAVADQASKAALIDEMMTVSDMRMTVKATMDQMRTAMLAQMKQLISKYDLESGAKDAEALLTDYQNKFFDILDKAMSWDALKPKMAALYDETFTEEELAGMVTFYKTPAGQSMLKKMPQLMGRAMNQSQEMLQPYFPELQRLSDELEAKCKQLAAKKK